MADQQPSAEGPGEFPVFVNTRHGKQYKVLVSPDQTVQELMDKLENLDSSVILAMGKLIYRNEQLEGKKTLRHYGIAPNSVVEYDPYYFAHRLELIGDELDIEAEGTELQSLLRQLKVSDSSDEALESTEIFPEVMTMGTSRHCSKYRAHLPREGVYRCSITGLAFEVNSAVIVTYRYARWNKHLSKDELDTLMPAGPLFNIEIEAGIVKTVFLPHFICLTECGADRPCFIAHFKAEKMTLEKPTLLMPFYAVLENPSFSLLGVLWRKMRSSFGSVPVHSLVLIFQVLSAANTTLHLYLIPDDKSVKRAIIKEEMGWKSEFIPKPPPLIPLFFGCVYRVAGTNSVVITPDERLTFCYKSPKEQQLFVEIYIKNVEEDTELSITNTRDNVKVWKTLLRSGDIKLTPQKTPPRGCLTSSGAAFVKKNKTELYSRMAQVPSILLHLRDANVINKDEEDEVLSQDTGQKKNRVLLDLLERKGLEAQEQLYQILRDKDPYLIADLEKSS